MLLRFTKVISVFARYGIKKANLSGAYLHLLSGLRPLENSE